jgi:hypothetical protein
MPRMPIRPGSVPDDDPVRWFARLVRAIGENDFPLAAIARERLYDLGWAIAHLPTEAPASPKDQHVGIRDGRGRSPIRRLRRPPAPHDTHPEAGRPGGAA